MNSLNLLSARVIGTTTSEKPQASRPRSYSEGNLNNPPPDNPLKRSASQHAKRSSPTVDDADGGSLHVEKEEDIDHSFQDNVLDDPDEKEPLLRPEANNATAQSHHSKIRRIVRRLAEILSASLKWALSVLIAPGTYILSGFYDEKDRFSPSAPLRKLSRLSFKNPGTHSTTQAVGLSRSPNNSKTSSRTKTNPKDTKRKSKSQKHIPELSSSSDGEPNEKLFPPTFTTEGRPGMLTSSSSDEGPQTRRSVRIKTYNEDTTRRRKTHREKEKAPRAMQQEQENPIDDLTIANIKSPTSPGASLRMTKYSEAPAPPRPLVPRRQPSYPSQPPANSRFAQKTLVIDLDETLIHSLAKGGRMSSGHMVEVKLNSTVGIGGTTLSPQHPILYYVHKRPHCDDFLRRICKWYNLVVFTASVQEYADPVIDWLEQERKFFSARFYRQHCTFRNGAYIKDLSSVEPDLRRVMILDNSPLSYIFHEGKPLAP